MPRAHSGFFRFHSRRFSFTGEQDVRGDTLNKVTELLGSRYDPQRNRPRESAGSNMPTPRKKPSRRMRRTASNGKPGRKTKPRKGGRIVPGTLRGLRRMLNDSRTPTLADL